MNEIPAAKTVNIFDVPNIVDAKPNGFLNIGDQHLISKPPGRRRPGYAGEILRKIDQSITICNERRLVPLFMGDLFDEPVEESEAIKSVLNRIISRCWTKPVFNTGNHDIAGVVLADADSLNVLGTSNLVTLASTSGPIAVYYMADGSLVLLGATPHGFDIPRDLSEWEGKVDRVIWMTHHDLGFEGAYPGAIEPYEIPGCDVVLNGHMHGYRDPVDYGRTIWCNFGAIARVSVAEIENHPSVVEVMVDEGQDRITFNRFMLNARPALEVFNMTGRQVEAGDLQISDIAPSAFVDSMNDDIGDSTMQTSSGDILRDQINDFMSEWQTPSDIQHEVNRLLTEVVAEIPEP